MIEISTGICNSPQQSLQELKEIREVLLGVTDGLGILVSGGGTHPFQKWDEQILVEDPRGKFLAENYGYLCNQLTVFGQHVHICCPGPDEALCLLHALSRYIPHFIALSASSPYVRGIDTTFDSARLNIFGAFPLSGRAPFLSSWDDFDVYFGRMRQTGVVRSMKDFYWDIRPKPEYGTVEVRVMDTPISLEKAADLAAYIQVLARWQLIEKPCPPVEDDYIFYDFNRFQAARFGLSGELVDARTGERKSIADDIRETLARIENHAMELGVEEACTRLLEEVNTQGNDAHWIRSVGQEGKSLAELVALQSSRWR